MPKTIYCRVRSQCTAGSLRSQLAGRRLMSLTLVLIVVTFFSLMASVGAAHAAKHPSLKANRKKFEKLHDVFVRMNNGRIAAVIVQRKSDHRYVFRAFPFGIRNAATADQPTKVTFAKVRKLLKKARLKRRGRHTGGGTTAQSAAATNSSSTASYVTGFPAGYSSTLGATTGDCFNFTVSTPNSGVTELSFNSASGVTNFSSVTKASASINAAFGEFQASNDFSYTGTYQQTTNSGQTVFTAESVFPLQPDLDTSNALNSYGTLQQTGGTFSYQCGDSFISQVPAGALIMGELTWSSTSSASSSDVSDEFSASGSALTNLKVAVSNSLSVSNSITTFNFDLVMDGGGATPVSAMLDSYASNSSYFATCTSGTSSDDQSACETFVSNLNSGAATALSDFNTEVSEMGTDLSFFEQFANGLSGVEGIATTETESLSSLISGSSDAFSAYSTQLNDFITLINQIATLNNRATLLNTTVGDSAFDPTTIFSMADHLDTLEKIYGTDLSTLLSDMNTCLGSSASSITTNCAKIIGNQTSGGTQIADAYDWYATGSPNPNNWIFAERWQAQQNTIALQYNSENFYQYSSGAQEYQTPMQVLYAFDLPSTFSDSSANDALISFADSTFYKLQTGSGYSEVSQPLVVAAPLSRSNDEPTSLTDLKTNMQLTNIGEINDESTCWGSACYGDATPQFTTSCSPTISDICTFKWGNTSGSSHPYLLFQNYEPILNFFTPAS